MMNVFRQPQKSLEVLVINEEAARTRECPRRRRASARPKAEIEAPILLVFVVLRGKFDWPPDRLSKKLVALGAEDC